MSKIEITFNPSGDFDVQFDDKLADGLTFDELLGLVAALAMPQSRPCLGWLKNAEERAAYEKWLANLHKPSADDPEFEVQGQTP